jgi:hypothetical protein
MSITDLENLIQSRESKPQYLQDVYGGKQEEEFVLWELL